jgi:uncharacterized protein YjbI with pentapeptide repeats
MRTEKAGQVEKNGISRDTLIGAALLGGLVLIALLLALIAGLRWYLSPENTLAIVKRKDLVLGLASSAQAVAVFLTGAAAVIGLLFTWRNLRQTRTQTNDTLEVTRQGQVTDRFSKAIDHLGPSDRLDYSGNVNDLEKRLGGIYALDQIAKDSPIKQHWAVMEILTSYVRAHTGENGAWQDTPPSGARSPSLDDDIQAVLKVLTRRDRTQETEAYQRLDLSYANLAGADLNGAHLEKARLLHINLHKADLREAHLSGADLSHANLERASLGERNFPTKGANLENATLNFAQLRSAGLFYARLKGAKLRAAKLPNARLHYADLRAADLTQASLQGARLHETKLQRASLVNANVSEAKLGNAHWEEADLQEANLLKADLKHADLRHAKNLTQDQINGAIGDETTLLPNTSADTGEALIRPPSWSSE